MPKRASRHACRWPRPERVRQPQSRRRLSTLWADCQAAMDAAVAFRVAGYGVLVCSAVPAPRVLITEGPV